MSVTIDRNFPGRDALPLLSLKNLLRTIEYNLSPLTTNFQYLPYIAKSRSLAIFHDLIHL